MRHTDVAQLRPASHDLANNKHSHASDLARPEDNHGDTLSRSAVLSTASSRTGGACLVDSLTAGEVAQRQLAHRAHGV